MSSNQTFNSSSWSWEENKAFENAVAMYSTDRNSLAQIAAAVPGRTVEDVSYHFKALFTDVAAIESGDVPLPNYSDSFKKSTRRKAHATVDNRGKQSRKDQIKFIDREISLQSDGNRRTAKPWSKEEHSLFLQGLQRFGRSDWRSISRFCVRSRTAVQVASHAQKYFKRMDVVAKDNLRPIIHDVTILDEGKIVTQQVPTPEQLAAPPASCLVDSESHAPPDTDGIALLNSNKDNMSMSQWPSAEETIGITNIDDLFNSLYDDRMQHAFGLQGVSANQGPSTEEITEAAGVSLCNPPIANQQNILISQEPITEELRQYPDDDFFELAFPGQYDISAPQGPMTGEVMWIDGRQGYSTVDFLECSFPCCPDFGTYASQIVSQPVAQPVPQNAACQPVPEPDLSIADGEPVPEPVPTNAAPPPVPEPVLSNDAGEPFPEPVPSSAANLTIPEHVPSNATFFEFPPSPEQLMYELYSPSFEPWFPSPPEDMLLYLVP